MEDHDKRMKYTGEINNGSHDRVNDSSMRISSSPLMSIITVVRNSEQDLACTMQSVIEQTYDNIEYIIIDGGSNDGTIQRIRDHEADIDIWISEPDSGIYDAMNKGVDRATGEWILFLNAGDLFANPEVLANIFRLASPDADVIYGRHEEMFRHGFSKIPRLRNMKHLWKGMIFCHQSMLVRTALMKSTKFNIRNKIAADYEFISALFAQRYRFQPVDLTVSRILADGYSSSNNIVLIREQWQVARRYFGPALKVNGYYFLSFASVALKNLIKRCLPDHLASFLRVRF